jgi:hypothetical protein
MTRIVWSASIAEKERQVIQSALSTAGVDDGGSIYVMKCLGSSYNLVVVTESALVMVFVPLRGRYRQDQPEVVQQIARRDLSQVAYKSRSAHGDENQPRRLYARTLDGAVTQLGLLMLASNTMEQLASALAPVPVSMDGNLIVLRSASEAPVDSGLFASLPEYGAQARAPRGAQVDVGLLKFFVSHASEDVQIAIDVTAELESQGVGTWLATRDIQVGQNYAAQIHDAIVQSSHLVVLLSPASISSVHVQREVNLALDQGKALLPVVVAQDADFMPTLPAQWKYWLGVVQVVPYSSPVSAVDVVLQSIGVKGYSR